MYYPGGLVASTAKAGTSQLMPVIAATLASLVIVGMALGLGLGIGLHNDNEDLVLITTTTTATTTIAGNNK